MSEASLPPLEQLLSEAEPFGAFATRRQAENPQARPPKRNSSADSASAGRGDIDEAVDAVRFLIENGSLSLSSREQWIRLGLALKNSFGEAGLAPWVNLSREADGFESEDDCRKTWESFKAEGNGAPLKVATYIGEARKTGWKPQAKRRENITGRGPSKNEDLAAFTVGLVEEAGDELWLDQEAKPYASYIAELLDGSTVPRHLPVHGSAYRDVLKERFFDASGGTKTLKDEQAAGAAAILAMRAKKGGVRHKVSLRVGEFGGRIYVDLGTPNGMAVEIDENDFRTVSDPPVRFVRGSRGELPIPEQGGTLADFQPHFNLGQDDLVRAIGVMIGTFNVSGSYPVLLGVTVDDHQRISERNYPAPEAARPTTTRVPLACREWLA